MPTLVLLDEVVIVAVILTVLLPQFLKQSGSESGMWASPPGLSSPSVGPIGGSGNARLTPTAQAGVQPTLNLRAPAPGGSSLRETSSNGSDGMVPNWTLVENMSVHCVALTKDGRLPHSLSKAPDCVSSTLVRKS